MKTQESNMDKLRNNCFRNFIVKGDKSSIKIKGKQVFGVDDDKKGLTRNPFWVFERNNNGLIWVSECLEMNDEAFTGEKPHRFGPDAIDISIDVLPRRLQRLLKSKRVLIINGDLEDPDTGDERFVDLNDILGINHPTISFECLRRILDKNNVESALKLLHNGKIRIVDFTLDETRNLSQQEKKQVRNYQEGKSTLLPPPPEFGLTLLNDQQWHRPASVVFEYNKPKSSHYYLMGQDEGTYFCCELPKRVRNLDEAYKSLIPKNVRDIGEWQRQGEWFAVPVNKSKVPNENNCAAVLCENDLILPMDFFVESKWHRLHCGEGDYVGCIGVDGQIYIKFGELEHEDHESLILRTRRDDKWWTFYRNTALKSVSVEGVD